MLFAASVQEAHEIAKAFLAPSHVEGNSPLHKTDSIGVVLIGDDQTNTRRSKILELLRYILRFRTRVLEEILETLANSEHLGATNTYTNTKRVCATCFAHMQLERKNSRTPQTDEPRGLSELGIALRPWIRSSTRHRPPCR